MNNFATLHLTLWAISSHDSIYAERCIIGLKDRKGRGGGEVDPASSLIKKNLASVNELPKLH